MADAAPEREPNADDDNPVAESQKRFRIAAEVEAENRRLALEDIRFARLGEQWPEKVRRDREQAFRPCLTLNQLPAYIRQVVNDARQNKPAITVHPVGSGADVETAKIYDGLIRHIERSSDAEVAYDTALDNAVTGGFGYFRIGLRYACDDTFEQELILERIADPLSVYGDPNAKAADSADWNECWVLDTITKEAFEKRWPDKDPVSFDTEGGFAQRAIDRSDEELITFAEHWTREEAPKTITVISAMDPDLALAMPAAAEQANQLLGQTMILAMDVYEANKELLEPLGMRPVGKPRDVISHKVTQRIESGADVLETVEWAGSYIPIVPVYGEEVVVEGERHFRSLVRDAKDPQRIFNYWRTTSTELVALAPKTPFIGAKGSFETDVKKWDTANVENHAFIEYDVVQGAPPPQRPPFAGQAVGAIAEAANAQNDIKSIIGIYNASLGAPSAEISGVAINARDKQADTGTFHFIDNLSRAIRHAGRILLDLIPHVYSTPRVLRILEPDGTPTMVPVNQPTPVLDSNGQPQMAEDPQTRELRAITRIYDLTAGKYDLTVQAGPSYATQRQEAASQMMDLIRSFPQAAPVVGDLIAKNLDWPGADEIAERLKALEPATGPNPQMEQASALIQKQGQALQQAQEEIRRLRGDQANDSRKLDIDAFEAETDRIKAFVGKEGAPIDVSQAAPLFMAMLAHTLTSPDLFDAMQQGADPNQLAAMLAAKMGQGADDQGGGSAPPLAA